MKIATLTSKSILCAALLAGLPLIAQVGGFGNVPYPSQQQFQQQAQPAQTQPLIPVDQLANLIAPIALYPDPLLGLVLAASTYPLEIVEAQQWLQQNRNLSGEQLIQAAKLQNWDPSVQTLVGFPDAMALLTRDIRWTTDVGNAFLAQQQDVMAAIQTMRARAQSNGRLVNGPQQIVTTEAQNGQSAIAIEPANPQVIYTPAYNPQTIWGPPAQGAYPQLNYAPPVYSANYYPPQYGNANYGGGYQSGYGASYGGYGGGYGAGNGSSIGSGILYGAGVILNTLFTGLTHFSPWGWALNWLVHGLFLNPGFFHSNGFHGYDGYGAGYNDGYSSVAWVHNPVHRLGIAYPNHFVAARFGGNYGGYGGHGGYRESGFRSEGFRSSGYNASSYAPRSEFRPQGFAAQNNRGNFGGGYNQHFAPQNRGYANPAPRQYAQNFGGSNFGNRSNGGNHFSEPKMSRSFGGGGGGHAEHFSAPKAPHFSGGGGHGGGGHSGGGGGHSGKGSHHH